MKKKGFTMAEILVALAIAGVIAIITIPVITAKKADDGKILFRKAYKTAEQISSDLVDDELAYRYDTINYGFKNTSPSIIKNIHYEGNTKFRELFKSGLKIKEDEGTTFITLDGIKWTVPNCSFTDRQICVTEESVIATGSIFRDRITGIRAYGPNDSRYINKSTQGGDIRIDIDTNDEKEPNCFCQTADCNDCPRPDRFHLIITNRGQVKVEGTKEKEYLDIKQVVKGAEKRY